MSAEEVIINEQALMDVSDGIKSYLTSLKDAIGTALRSIRATNVEWEDEDFNLLVSAVGSFLQDVENIENATDQLVERIDNKISAIHVLHSMKI